MLLIIKNVATGNITFSISDHLPQFFFLLDFFSNNFSYKRNAEVYDWSRFNKNSFLDDFNRTYWNSVMEIDKKDVSISFNRNTQINYVTWSNEKNMFQQQAFLQKPWFTTTIQNSIQKKNVKYQNPVTKNDLHRDKVLW